MDLSFLNETQKRAVTSDHSALLILAGAGSGKTQTLTTKIAYMIKVQGIPKASIVAMTFTNKAANEMKVRASQLCELNPTDLNIGTFHSMCLRILKIFKIVTDFTIIDQNESLKIYKMLCKDVDNIANIRKIIDDYKNDGLEWNDIQHCDKNTIDLYHQYTKYCRDNNLIDYGDLLILAHNALVRNPNIRNEINNKWRHILVDEFQDTNEIQMKIVKLLSPPNSENHSITVVGDDYQSIHGWRGAKIENILKLNEQYTNLNIERLEINYRSSEIIVKASNALILNNRKQYMKKLVANVPDGSLITISSFQDETSEAKSISESIKKNGKESYGNTAILFRTNAQSKAFEKFLQKENIPFLVKGARGFYERSEIKDILAYLRLFVNPHSNEDFKRVANVPPRKVGAVTLKKLEAQENVSLYTSASQVKKHKGVADFLDIINEMHMLNSNNPHDLCSNFSKFLQRSLYIDRMFGQDHDANVEKIENINALISALREFEDENSTLQDFLNEICLSQIENSSGNPNAVHLMTAHTSKGLEFENVYIVGAGEGIFPHDLILAGNGELDEERRLFYVAMTRAKRNLNISFMKSRIFFGKYQNVQPSRFIMEIPYRFCKHM